MVSQTLEVAHITKDSEMVDESQCKIIIKDCDEVESGVNQKHSAIKLEQPDDETLDKVKHSKTMAGINLHKQLCEEPKYPQEAPPEIHEEMQMGSVDEFTQICESATFDVEEELDDLCQSPLPFLNKRRLTYKTLLDEGLENYLQCIFSSPM